eukprot:5195734-Prymnesium_polylepis.1
MRVVIRGRVWGASVGQARRRRDGRARRAAASGGRRGVPWGRPVRLPDRAKKGDLSYTLIDS